MWSVNDFPRFIMLFLLYFASGQMKLKFPIGSDVTLTCRCHEASSCKVSFPKRPNVREIRYEDTLYIVLSNIVENNRGTYRCINDGMMVDSKDVEITELNDKDEMVIYRSVGDDFLLFCKMLKNIKPFKWTWIPANSLNETTIDVHSNNRASSTKHFSSRLGTSNETKSAIKISPVSFMDSGKYKCRLPEHNKEATINLVTVEVSANPSSSVTSHSNVTLTCSLSHILPNTRISFVWVQMNGTGPHALPGKNRTVDSESLEHTIFLEDINEDKINWTCLVFNETLLMALAPIRLNYTHAWETLPSPTDVTETTSTEQVLIDNKGLHKEIILLVISAITMILIMYLLLKRYRLLDKSGGSKIDPKSQDVQYVSVHFVKKTKIPPSQASTSESRPEASGYRERSTATASVEGGAEGRGATSGSGTSTQVQGQPAGRAEESGDGEAASGIQPDEPAEHEICYAQIKERG